MTAGKIVCCLLLCRRRLDSRVLVLSKIPEELVLLSQLFVVVAAVTEARCAKASHTEG